MFEWPNWVIGKNNKMATNELFNGLCNLYVKLGNGVKARALNWVHPFCQLKSDSQCLYNKYNQYNPLNIQNWNSKDNRPSVSIKFKLISMKYVQLLTWCSTIDPFIVMGKELCLCICMCIHAMCVSMCMWSKARVDPIKAGGGHRFVKL